MNTGRAQNLKKVLDAVPTGYLVDAKWLTAHGIAYESFRDYVNRGWLERVYRGIFRRPASTADKNNTLDWETCVLSLQHIIGAQDKRAACTAAFWGIEQSPYGRSYSKRTGSAHHTHRALVAPPCPMQRQAGGGDWIGLTHAPSQNAIQANFTAGSFSSVIKNP